MPPLAENLLPPPLTHINNMQHRHRHHGPDTFITSPVPLSLPSESPTEWKRKPVITDGASNWSAVKSASLYRIHSWGAPYFTVNSDGNVAVRPFGDETKPGQEIDLHKVILAAIAEASSSSSPTPSISSSFTPTSSPTPLVIRFPDVLKHRLTSLQAAFDSSIASVNYQAQFQGVFPVKCNQDRFVVDNIVQFGKPFAFGLEAGSKPELLLAMASLSKAEASPHTLLICNGYKDAQYVSLALMAKKLRMNCVIVLEQEDELDVVLAMARKLSIEPLIGLRAKLNTKHAGHFGETSGENGKFGLSCSQIVQVVSKLKHAKMLHCLQLLHFHIGSQIPSVEIVYDGVSEAAHIYCELSLMGAGMKYIDIGGGLGIDYDGSGSENSDMSVGYTIQEYAKQVVLAVKNACSIKGVNHPTICSESGRALVSHHSVLVFDVLSSQVKSRGLSGHGDKGVSFGVNSSLPEELSSLQQSLRGSVREQDYGRSAEYAKQMKLECLSLFKQGLISLSQLASIDSLYEVVMAFIAEKRHHDNLMLDLLSAYDFPSLHSNDAVDDGQIAKETSHSAVYHINLSVFKSMPDTWAIDQLFPIVPLHRLEEEPTVRAILSDLTCDSDGKVTKFVGSEGKGNRMDYMKVHPLKEGKPYYLGMFLGGAYQEALGGMHNLFGSPPVLQVVHANKGGVEGCNLGNAKLSKVSDGHKVSDVLRGMQYEPLSMLDTLFIEVQKCLKDGEFDGEEDTANAMMQMLTYSFASSTYLSANGAGSASPVLSTILQPIVMG